VLSADTSSEWEFVARQMLVDFAYAEDLAEQMLCFVETYNQTAQPFAWTDTGKVLSA
jgi:hypothetical protein